MEPLEEPPGGNVDIAEVKRRYGHRLCLKGNINTFQFLLRATPQQVEEKAKRLVTLTSIAATAKVSVPAKASVPARVAAPAREEEPAAEGAPAKKKSRRRRWKKKPGGAAPAQGPAA